MIRLVEGAPLRCVLPGGRDPVAWHAVLVEEIGRHLSSEHARILGRPERVAGGLAWDAEGAARTRYSELPGEGRRALDAALGAILSDIRRLAESGVAPGVREAWPALRDVPDMGHVFAVDGRPVLAGWGHLGADGVVGRLARLDDGVAWRAVPVVPWGRYAAVAGVLALLGLAAGLVLPFAGSWLVPKPASCAIEPGQLQAMRDQAALDDRGAELRTLLATLAEDTGRRQLLCPIAWVRPPPAPVPAPQPAPPPPPPPPRADLPQDRWDRRDLSLLEGCWHLESTITVSNDAATQFSRVRTWQQCFDGHGSGRQTMVLEDGRRCEGPLGAAFAENGELRVTEPTQCVGAGLHMAPSTRLCKRVSDTEAVCDGRNLGGALAGRGYSGKFRR